MRLPGFLSLMCAILVSSMCLAGSATAEDCDRKDVALIPANIPDKLLDQLVGWIALNTNYDLSTTYRSPPEILLCDVGTSVPYEESELPVNVILNAAYDLKRRRIYLVRPWSAENPKDVSVLLHELIHDVQHLNREWDCIAAPEYEAYWLQDKWLAEEGIGSAFNWEAIRQFSTCP